MQIFGHDDIRSNISCSHVAVIELFPDSDVGMPPWRYNYIQGRQRRILLINLRQASIKSVHVIIYEAYKLIRRP